MRAKCQQHTLGLISLIGQQVLLIDAIELVYEDADKVTFLFFAKLRFGNYRTDCRVYGFALIVMQFL